MMMMQGKAKQDSPIFYCILCICWNFDWKLGDFSETAPVDRGNNWMTECVGECLCFAAKHNQTAPTSASTSSAVALGCPTQTALNEAQPVIGKQCSLVQEGERHTLRPSKTRQDRLRGDRMDRTNWTEAKKKKKRAKRKTKEKEAKPDGRASGCQRQVGKTADSAATAMNDDDDKNDKRDLN